MNNANTAMKIHEPLPDERASKFREMPHNFEAEQGLIGMLLVDNDNLDKVCEILQPHYFSNPAHERIYSAIETLIGRGQQATPMTLKDYFAKDAELESVGGADYLAELQAEVPLLNKITDYAETIRDRYERREIIRRCRATALEAYQFNIERSARDILEDHEQDLFGLADTGTDGAATISFQSSLETALALAEKAFNAGGAITGVTTGFRDIDNRLGGLQPTDLLILAGRPSMGKTSLATNIAFNAARAHMESAGRAGAKVGFFSKEMSADQLTTRILGDVSGISSDAIRKGKISADQFRHLATKSREFAALPLFIDETPGLSIAALRTRARRMKRQHGIGLLVVDYLQLVQGEFSRKAMANRTQEISEITKGLKGIAKDLHIPVLALSQLSRKVEDRDDKRPMLSDLRESGSIEEDADVVMFVYRPEYYLERGEPAQRANESEDKFNGRHNQWWADLEASRNITEVITAKQRHGPIGTDKLYFDPALTRFKDMEGDGQ